MQIVAASTAWAGPNTNAFTLFVEPMPLTWVAESALPRDTQIYIYQALDKKWQKTGQLAGVHITGFLDFDRWSDLPRLDMLWQLPGSEPLSLEALLRAEQVKAREDAAEHNALVRAAAQCV